MRESLNLQHCTTNGLQNFNQSLELCATNTAINFMNDPFSAARNLFILLIISTVFSFIICLWGMKRDNTLMLLSGLFAAIFVYKGIDGSAIAIIAILLGHSLGFLFASKRYKKVQALHKQPNISKQN